MKVCRNCDNLVPQRLNFCPFCDSKDFDDKFIDKDIRRYRIKCTIEEIKKLLYKYGIYIIILLGLIVFILILFFHYLKTWTPGSTTIFVSFIGVIGSMLGVVMKHIFSTIESEKEHKRKVKGKMFEKIHEYIKNHYCHLSWHALIFSLSIEDAKSSLKDSEIKLAFFFLARFYSILRRLEEEIGRVVLESPLAEMEINYILALVGIKLKEIGINFKDLNMLRKLVDPPLKNKTWLYFDKFLELLNEDKNINNIYQKFKTAVEKNIRALEQLIELLKVLAVEFEYHIYKIYRTWYGESPSYQAQLEFINSLIKSSLKNT